MMPLTDNQARNAGTAWAARCIEEFSEQGRPIAGGWPGTKSEARRIAARQLRCEGDLLTSLSEEVYQAAKDLWMAQTVPNRGLE